MTEPTTTGAGARDADIDRLMGPVSQGSGAIWEMTDRMTDLARLAREARDRADQAESTIEILQESMLRDEKTRDALETRVRELETENEAIKATTPHEVILTDLLRKSRAHAKAAERERDELRKAVLEYLPLRYDGITDDWWKARERLRALAGPRTEGAS